MRIAIPEACEHYLYRHVSKHPLHRATPQLCHSVRQNSAGRAERAALYFRAMTTDPCHFSLKEQGPTLWEAALAVNAGAPGFVRTDMTAAMPESALAAVEAKIPIGRLAEAGEIADACLFLASDEARYVNGHVLAVDGGLTL